MARSPNGKLRGRARQAELRDQRNLLLDEQTRRDDAAKLAKEAAEIEDENDAIRRCVVVEGEPSFYQWWDDDEQVPPYGLRRERIEMIEKRIAALTLPSPEGRGAEVVSKHKGSIANEQVNGTESQ